ncbi:hypothetical protein [Sinorhizobium fredii]|uniref:hypothetical protein n=1 Tax=Rhizobium fredii TaxID=380 RepID=UPI0004B0D9C1|nr:hypothetical protein [Sinorhizobium fredii]
MMKASNALIAWNPTGLSDNSRPPGGVAIGPLLTQDQPDWTIGYECTGGAAWANRRKLFGMPQRFNVMMDWHQLVYSYGIHPYVAHRAFLFIEEYQAIIRQAGAGPDKDEPGHDQSIPYGRCAPYKLPSIQVRAIGQSFHVWPMP